MNTNPTNQTENTRPIVPGKLVDPYTSSEEKPYHLINNQIIGPNNKVLNDVPEMDVILKMTENCESYS